MRKAKCKRLSSAVILEPAVTIVELLCHHNIFLLSTPQKLEVGIYLCAKISSSSTNVSAKILSPQETQIHNQIKGTSSGNLALATDSLTLCPVFTSKN